MKTVLRVALVVLLTVSIAGCFGGPPPREEFLRLPLAACGGCDAVVESGSSAVVVAVKSISALPALERSAVMVADGSVVSPSVSLYWEGSPAEIVERGIAGCLGCAGLASAWPYSPRADHDALLTGHVEAFEVQTKGDRRFVASVRFELWSKRGKALVGARTFRAQRAIGAPRAQAIAEAADAALGDILKEAATWTAEELSR